MLFFQWEVGARVLEVFYQLLFQHEVAAEDFLDQTVDVQGGGKALANKSPGHNLMVHLLNDTSMLKMVRFPQSENEWSSPWVKISGLLFAI